MEKFESVYEKWSTLNINLYNECVNYIKSVLETAPNKTIMFDSDYAPCVTYDGGSHPEYDANPYSMVECLYIKGDDVCMDTEDTTEYSVKNISAIEIYEVASNLKLMIENVGILTDDEDDDEE